MLNFLLDWFLHLDTHLGALAANHGTLVYLVLFSVVFFETGIVVTPFLPGDSLLFVAGALTAQQVFEPSILIPTLVTAAIAGDTVNYAVGSVIRRRAIDSERLRFLKAEYVERTRSFFDRYGPKTIVLARFVPIVRTLAPFIAALGRMEYGTFLKYNIIGGLLWVLSLVGAGYTLASLPLVSDHLNAVLLSIVALSLSPGLISKAAGGARARRR